MELRDAVVVVTGGGSGIGAALCRRFAREGPASVVVADLDRAAAESVADEVAAALRSHGGSGSALAVGCDVADEASVDDLVARAGGAGAVDLFCANAGVATGAGIEAPVEVWERAWQVNVMGHVHAARALLPTWLERGRGHLLTTASAAGLLTNLGDAPYSATKHAAVAFAEWLSITYGDRGIRVSCLCPQGVRTPMLFPDGTDAALAAEVVRAQGVLEPEDVADVVVAGLAEERFLILPHPEVADFERNRAGDRERWLRGMRRLQARLGG
jgi:NAD(P)-dependent dehydrogenase (short-subunit alcohol dehydrogenase family)